MEENRLEHGQEGFSLCLWVRERLPELDEGYLDAMTAEAVRAHLSVCYLCQKEYADIQHIARFIETMPFAEPDHDFAPAIMAAIEQQRQGNFAKRIWTRIRPRFK